MRLMNGSFGVLLLMSACVPCGALAHKEKVDITVSARKCHEEAPPVRVVVFDASKVPELTKLMQNFNLHGNPQDEAAANKMLGIYNTLYRRIANVPALYRSKEPFSGQRTISVPPVKRYAIFALGQDEGELTSIAEREFEPKTREASNVVLILNGALECPEQ